MKKILVSMMCLAVLPAIAQTVPPPISAEQIAAYKKLGASTANSIQSRSVKVNETGEIQYDSQGNAVMATPGTSSYTDKSRYVNAMTGVTGYENIAEPGRGGTAAASVSGRSFVDFSCNLAPGAQESVFGRLVKFGGCTTNDTAITSIKLSICSVTLQGGTCRPSDFTAERAFAVNAYDKLDNLRMGVGCNESNKTCRITLEDSYGIAGNGAQLTAQASQKVEQAGSNSAQADIAQRYLSDSYSKRLEQATSITACTEAQMQSAAKTGIVATCGTDGQAVATSNVVGTSNSADCKEEAVCTRKAVRTVSYNQSCTRTFPLTGYSCSFNIPKLECTVTKDVVSGTLTNSCSKESLSGALKVRSDESTAECVAKDLKDVCITQRWTEYYTQPEKASIVGDCSTAPFPMSGSPNESCLNRGKGTGSTCSADGWWQRTLTDNECTVIKQEALPNGNMSETIYDLTEAEKAGCGVCTSPTKHDTCYARPTDAEPQDSCANIDFNSCRLVSSTPQSQFEGMTLSQQDVYSCEKQEESCAEYDKSNLCTPVSSGITFGLDKERPLEAASSAGMNSALTDAALIDAIATGTEQGSESDPFVPKIFGGTDDRCTKPVGFFNGVVDNDCCRMDLDRPGGGKLGNKCSADEVKLATARRSNFTHYVGEYCSKKSGLLRTCKERTQTYCAYKGLLPRIVQEQGRDQLIGLANSGASGSIQKTSTKFAFYEGKGGWGNQVSLNGVTIVPWQFPAYCADPEKAAQALATDPNAQLCPTALVQRVAVCEKTQGCGSLPVAPELGSETWLIATIDPLKNQTTAVSRYAMMTGACDPASTLCQYEVAAWPAGVGGRAVASKQVSFPIFAQQQQAAQALSGVPQDINAMGDYIFRPVSLSGTASPTMALPQTVRIDFSPNGGQSFSSVNVPTKIVGTDFSFPGASDLRITGGCDAAANLCTYYVTGTVTVTAKPWGSPERPDCEGFSMGQMAVLDFSKMDLSEWVASITKSVLGANTSNLSQAASSRVQQMMDARKSGTGTVSSSNPQALQTATITPAEEVGPFVATLRVHGNFPVYYENAADNIDPVSRVEVDWGDCTIPEVASQQSASGSGITSYGFIAKHQYVSPEKVPLACGGGRNSIAHAVKVKIYAKSGVHEMTLKTVNVWNTYTGASSLETGATNTQVTVPLPSGGR